MSKKIENHCVDCDLPCLGNSCPYQNVEVFYCDICGSGRAKYRVCGDDYCKECMVDFLKDSFNELTIMEKAKALEIDIQNIDDVL